MRLRVWGARGSLAAPGPETVRYGGNTPCVEVRSSEGRLIIIDAGTGIRRFGLALREERPDVIDILLTHLHLDGIEGLAYFDPIWREGSEIHIWAPPSPTESLHDRMARYFSPPIFPIHMDDLPSHVVLHETPEAASWRLGEVAVTAQPVSHPGPTLGFRLEEEGRVLAYISDHEPALGIDMATVGAEWISGYAIARGADVLIHDAQFTEEEYRPGLGHSTVAHAVAFARIAGVRRLVLFSHDPMHSDADLEGLWARAMELWREEDGDVVLAYEGMEIDLSSSLS